MECQWGFVSSQHWDDSRSYWSLCVTIIWNLVFVQRHQSSSLLGIERCLCFLNQPSSIRDLFWQNRDIYSLGSTCSGCGRVDWNILALRLSKKSTDLVNGDTQARKRVVGNQYTCVLTLDIKGLSLYETCIYILSILLRREHGTSSQSYDNGTCRVWSSTLDISSYAERCILKAMRAF